MPLHRIPPSKPFSRPSHLLSLLLILLLVGCTESPSFLRPASSASRDIASLFWGITAIAVVIFLVVEVLLVVAVLRFRDRPGASEPRQFHGNTRLEVAWTLAPTVIVAGIFIATVSTMNALSSPQEGSLRVKVVGHQWWWEVQYPDLAVTTANEIHVPVGQPVRVELVAADVIHSFWAPELFGKVDVIPGHTNWAQFTADRPGTYQGQCAEFCGVQHAHMGFLIVAHPGAEFDDWTRQNAAPASTPTAGQAERGAEAFLKGTCAGCHTVQGTSAKGVVGPDLTHFASRKAIAAGTVDNTPENLAAWLSDPQRVKPGNNMIIPPLSRETIQDLMAYLDSLK